MPPKLYPLWKKLIRIVSSKNPRSRNSVLDLRTKTKGISEQLTSAEAVILSQSDLQNLPSETFLEATKGDCSWQTLLSAPTTKSNTFTVGIGTCKPGGGCLALHRHRQAEIYHILSGTGVVTIEAKQYHVATGDVVFIPGDAEHGVVNNHEDSELKWLYCFAVDGFEDVIYRFSGTHKLKKAKRWLVL